MGRMMPLVTLIALNSAILILASNPINPVPSSSLNQCRQHSIDPSKSQPRTLADIVGVGWDNLRNEPMAAIFDTAFARCQLTADSQFWLPDGLSALPVQQSELDRVASFYETYHDYFDSNALSINLEAGANIYGKASISGKLSKDHIEMKERSSSMNTSILNTKLRFHYATLIGSMNSPLDPTFKKSLSTLAAAISKNDTELAKFISRVTIRDFGTHVITRAEIGASVSQDDYVDAESMVNQRITVDEMKASAAASFYMVFNVNISIGRRVETRNMDGFYSTVRHTRVSSRGGPDVNRLLASTTTGDRLVIDDVVALDRSGEPLFYIVTPTNLPELADGDLVWTMGQYLKNATDEYYVRNTRYGCTDPSADNFDINANADDGTCRQPFNNFTFSGFYQSCRSDADGDGRCDGANRANGITGSHECPAGYEAVQLLDIREPLTCCHTDGWWLWKKTRCHACYRELRTHWCTKLNSSAIPRDSGYMFAGLFSKTQINPYTGSASCPGRFRAYPMFFDVQICLSREYETDHKYSVLLAHFFTCQTPSNEARCPEGYSQVLATIVDGCEVYYCIRPERNDRPRIVDANRPPYGEFVFREAKLEEKTNVALSHSSPNIAAIILGVTTGLAVLTALAIFVQRKRKIDQLKSRLTIDNERTPILDEGATNQAYQAIDESAAQNI